MHFQVSTPAPAATIFAMAGGPAALGLFIGRRLHARAIADGQMLSLCRATCGPSPAKRGRPTRWAPCPGPTSRP